MLNYFTFKEIQEQPELLKKILNKEKEIKKILPLTDRGRVAFIGCGSSYYLPIAVAYHVRRKINIPAYAFTGFGTFRYPNTRFEKNKDYFIHKQSISLYSRAIMTFILRSSLLQ